MGYRLYGPAMSEAKPRRRRERFHGRVERPEPAPCARPGCTDAGEFRAPVNGAPAGTWQYLCLDHVREFNAGYSWAGPIPGPTDRWDRATAAFAKNAYASAFVDPLGIFGEDARPVTTPSRWTPAERNALTVLDLGESASATAIRARYKELVRRYHPDMNGGDRSHEARLQAVIDAFSQLKRARAFSE
ncbi:MAG: J domain-containing protein [Pacificimonas sp.]